MDLLSLWRRATIERICAKLKVYLRNESFDFKSMKKTIFFRDTNAACVHCKMMRFGIGIVKWWSKVWVFNGRLAFFRIKTWIWWMGLEEKASLRLQCDCFCKKKMWIVSRCVDILYQLWKFLFWKINVRCCSA